MTDHAHTAYLIPVFEAPELNIGIPGGGCLVVNTAHHTTIQRMGRHLHLRIKANNIEVYIEFTRPAYATAFHADLQRGLNLQLRPNSRIRCLTAIQHEDNIAYTTNPEHPTSRKLLANHQAMDAHRSVWKRIPQPTDPE